MIRKLFYNSLIFNNNTRINTIIKITLNKLFYNGKFAQANKIFSTVLLLILDTTKINPLYFYLKALWFIFPDIKFYSRYQENIKFFKSINISFLYSLKIAITWLILSIVEYKDIQTYSEKLATEIVNINHGNGICCKKKLKYYEFILENKEFCILSE